jgi:type IV pilus assembly protein PilX
MTRTNQRGMALITSLLLLAVVTILAVGMFRSFSVQEQIAGNLREKQRALHAAVTAQQYAEWWLTQDNNAASLPIACQGLLSANLKQGRICTNKLTSVTNPPLEIGGEKVGVTYNPGGNMDVRQTDLKRDSYWDVPRFHIAHVGTSADLQGEVYQIDAVGYGATSNAVAVVESTFVLKAGVVDRGGP